MFADLTDVALTAVFNNTAEGIVKYTELSPEEQRTPKGKDNAPISSMPLTAHFFVNAAREMEHRGLLPAGWLDA